MNNSKLFKQAHAMTRETLRAGDDYRVTFGACLKAIKASEAKKAEAQESKIDKAIEIILKAFAVLVCVVLVGFTGFLVSLQIGVLPLTMAVLGGLLVATGIILIISNEKQNGVNHV